DLGEPDLQWPQCRVVLEPEGPSHLRPEHLARAIERTERRRDAGPLQARTTARDLRPECRSAIVRTRAALASRGARGGRAGVPLVVPEEGEVTFVVPEEGR